MASEKLIVSVSGVRGIVGENLDAQGALGFASALGTWVEGRPVVLGRDSRPTGRMLHAAVAAGLMNAGCTVHDLGIAPTPTIGFAVRELHAAAAIQITASHNPAPYNGLKIFSPLGRVLTMEEGQRFVELYRSGERRQAKWNEVGWLEDRTDIQQRHIDRVLQQVDVETIRRRQFRVLVDANHGAGGPLMVNLLERLGCGVHGVGLNPDGLFAHEPEPTEENLRGVAPSVAKEGCALGLALDPDSDRLALIDEKGHYIGEELTLALALRYRLAQQRGPVVVNMSTSRLAEDLAQRFGCAFARSAVGEANVVQRMMGLKAVLGGEGNGGVIDPRVGWVRDPYIGTAMVLALLAETGRSLSNLVAELPTYSIVKDKFKVDGTRLPLVYEALRKQWSNVPTNTEDGLRLDWQDRWVHIRPSNTEPVVRIIAEAPSASLAQALIRETANVMSSVL